MKKLFQLIIILVVISCSSETAENDVMDESQMVEFLIDLHLSEAAVQDLRLKPDSAKVVFTTVEKYLFKKHNIGDSTFIRSYNYYLERPDRLEEIYNAVIDSLSLRQVLHRESGEQ